ncbi:hypothetical protein GX51_07356 [Blastomyces parvus]|uniref:Uncharacterized protein n=1 Tax=Blastomyces parvus TaxID=2060905 RepID=A0A2B7WLB7_9EURO|nr:hypothetical protein GX51_07356 [Blastomyces parvus]
MTAARSGLPPRRQMSVSQLQRGGDCRHNLDQDAKEWAAIMVIHSSAPTTRRLLRYFPGSPFCCSRTRSQLAGWLPPPVEIRLVAGSTARASKGLVPGSWLAYWAAEAGPENRPAGNLAKLKGTIRSKQRPSNWVSESRNEVGESLRGPRFLEPGAALASTDSSARAFRHPLQQSQQQ